jgi:DNA-binding transcriptional MerR regulator
MEKNLPPIPAKRYFTIGEVGELCGVKPHVLRYWEQEFTQLRPMKRRGNRRYYQHHEVLMIRRIRELLYDEGFTISGARNRLQEFVQAERERRRVEEETGGRAVADAGAGAVAAASSPAVDASEVNAASTAGDEQWRRWQAVRRELEEIRGLLDTLV